MEATTYRCRDSYSATEIDAESPEAAAQKFVALFDDPALEPTTFVVVVGEPNCEPADEMTIEIVRPASAPRCWSTPDHAWSSPTGDAECGHCGCARRGDGDGARYIERGED